MKPCPYCAESIQDSAVKCRYCGSLLDQGTAAGYAGPVMIGPPCPRCGSTSQRSGPWPWYLGTVGAMLMKVVICNRCGHEFDARKPEADLATRKRNLAWILNGIGGAGIVLIVGGLVALIIATSR